jgi:hypothetical protein
MADASFPADEENLRRASEWEAMSPKRRSSRRTKMFVMSSTLYASFGENFIHDCANGRRREQ